jgi:hypothetical protein
VAAALAVDMTARNQQEEVKKKGLPWSAVKGYDTFTPISAFVPASEVKDPHNLQLSLKINDSVKQDGNTSNLIFPIPRLIEHISSIMTLEVRPPVFCPLFYLSALMTRGVGGRPGVDGHARGRRPRPRRRPRRVRAGRRRVGRAARRARL